MDHSYLYLEHWSGVMTQSAVSALHEDASFSRICTIVAVGSAMRRSRVGEPAGMQEGSCILPRFHMCELHRYHKLFVHLVG